MKIAFATLLPIQGFSRLSEHTLLFPVNGHMHPEAKEAEILVSNINERVTGELLDQMPRVRLVANYGVGYNNIDLEACRERGIRVTNTPQPVIEPTAEQALALMLCVARRVSELDRKLREGTAEPIGVMNNLGSTLCGKTLGIIGMGNIGRALARRAEACGMRIVYHNRHQLTDTTATYLSMDELLQTSDYVSLNLPYTPAVHHLIGEAQLRMMKPSAFLINTARGGHIDEQALIKALREKWIAGAAMDVFEHEPAISPELFQLDNVVLSPHVGTGTRDARLAMCENVVDNILYFINNQTQLMNLVV